MSKSVIFFKSKSCPNCKMIEPIFNEVIELYKDNVGVVTIDITEDIQQAVEKGVMSVPTIIFLKDDREVERLIGVVSKDKIVHAIDNLQVN